MRTEDQLAQMVRSRNPMMPPGPPDMPPGAPPSAPQDMMMEEPMPPEIMQEQQMEPDLPKTATVMEVQGGTVILKDETGKTRKVPIGDFPIPPQEGMQMVQAVVGEIHDGMMVALVGPEQTPVELPTEGLQGTFEQGDYFWMPAPPSAAPTGEAPPLPPTDPMDEIL